VDVMTSEPETTARSRDAAARSAARRAAWRANIPGAAGATYLMAWVTGLAVWPVNLPLNATAAQAAASHAAHPVAAATQYLLVEGLAGLLLAAVLGSVLLPRLRARTDRRATLTAAVFGVIAVVTSLAQSVIGVILVSAARGGNIATSGDLFTLVNRLDGVKMLALAVAAVCLAVIGRPTPALPRWLRGVAIPLAVALAVSGYAYLTLTNALAWTPFVSGVLLLLWVTGTGIALTVRLRAPANPSPVAGHVGA
jgi:hypothetical protein